MRCRHCTHLNSPQARVCARCSSALDDSESDLRDERTITPPGHARATTGTTAATLAEESHSDSTLSDEPTLQGPRSLGGGTTTQAPRAAPGAGTQRYEVLEELGRGGMGVVYLARDRRFLEGLQGLERRVVVKRISVPDPHAVERFLRETRAIAALDHENIVAIHDFGEDEQGPFIVMGYLPQGSLRNHVVARGPLNERSFYEIARGIARALAYVHQRRIVHRDVKPSNVLLTSDGLPKLADFGLVRIGDEPSDLSSGYGMGTADYAAPEQKRGGSGVDQRADLYALGATLYFAATGDSPKTIRESRIPERWRALILRCLEDSAAARFQNAEEFLVALDAARERSTQTPATPTLLGPKCGNCSTTNRSDEKYCRTCGAGLFRACPRCSTSVEIVARYCGSCGLDIEAWALCESCVQSAMAHVAAGNYSEAFAELDKAERAFPGREDVRKLRQESRKKNIAVLNAVDEAEHFARAGRNHDAAAAWRRVLTINPLHARAAAELQRLTERARRKEFDGAMTEFNQAVAEGHWPNASRALARLRGLTRGDDQPTQAHVLEATQRFEGLLDIERATFDRAVGAGNADDARQALRLLAQMGCAEAELRQRTTTFERLETRLAVETALAARDWERARARLSKYAWSLGGAEPEQVASLRDAIDALRVELVDEHLATFERALSSKAFAAAADALDELKAVRLEPEQAGALAHKLKFASQRARRRRRWVRVTVAFVVTIVVLGGSAYGVRREAERRIVADERAFAAGTLDAHNKKTERWMEWLPEWFAPGIAARARAIRERLQNAPAQAPSHRVEPQPPAPQPAPPPEAIPDPVVPAPSDSGDGAPQPASTQPLRSIVFQHLRAAQYTAVSQELGDSAVVLANDDVLGSAFELAQLLEQGTSALRDDQLERALDIVAALKGELDALGEPPGCLNAARRSIEEEYDSAWRAAVYADSWIARVGSTTVRLQSRRKFSIKIDGVLMTTTLCSTDLPEFVCEQLDLTALASGPRERTVEFVVLDEIKTELLAVPGEIKTKFESKFTKVVEVDVAPPSLTVAAPPKDGCDFAVPIVLDIQADDDQEVRRIEWVCRLLDDKLQDTGTTVGGRLERVDGDWRLVTSPASEVLTAALTTTTSQLAPQLALTFANDAARGCARANFDVELTAFDGLDNASAKATQRVVVHSRRLKLATDDANHDKPIAGLARVRDDVDKKLDGANCDSEYPDLARNLLTNACERTQADLRAWRGDPNALAALASDYKTIEPWRESAVCSKEMAQMIVELGKALDGAIRARTIVETKPLETRWTLNDMLDVRTKLPWDEMTKSALGKWLSTCNQLGDKLNHVRPIEANFAVLESPRAAGTYWQDRVVHRGTGLEFAIAFRNEWPFYVALDDVEIDGRATGITWTQARDWCAEHGMELPKSGDLTAAFALRPDIVGLADRLEWCAEKVPTDFFDDPRKVGNKLAPGGPYDMWRFVRGVDGKRRIARRDAPLDQADLEHVGFRPLLIVSNSPEWRELASD